MTVRSIILLPLLMLLGLLYQQTGGDLGDTLTHATPLENWQVIAGVVLPGVLALIIQTHWASQTKVYASMAASLLVAFVAALLSDRAIIVPEVVIRALEVFAITAAMYLGAWKPTGAAPAIEAATTANSRRATT